MCFFSQLVDFKVVGSFYFTTIVVILLIEGTLVFPYLFGMLLYFQMPFLVSCTMVCAYEPIYIFYFIVCFYKFCHAKCICCFCGMILVCVYTFVSSPSILEWWGQHDDVIFHLVFKVLTGSVLHYIIWVLDPRSLCSKFV